MVTIRNVKARDIMQERVVTFTPSTSIQSAIESLEELHISGAPVVDGSGNIVGMLSVIDVAKTEHMTNDLIQTERGEYQLAGMDDDEQREFEAVMLSPNNFSPPTVGRTTVGEWMSGGIVSVDPDCGLRTICRLMVSEHIHRVPVVERRKLIGIISTLDIVRCIAGDSPLSEIGSKASCSRDSVQERAKRTAPSRTSTAAARRAKRVRA